MSSSTVRIPTLVSIAFALAGGLCAAEPAIIAKARAFLGTDAALDAVKSVHYVGTVVAVDPADSSKQTRTEIDIISQKPDQQRVVARSDNAIEITAVDGYEGWQRTELAANVKVKKPSLIVFKPEAVKRARAQAWENLSFFRGIESMGGRIEEQGTATIDGLVCPKIAFIYAPNIIFYRYFDPATGRLVLTETEDGGTTREEGEAIVDGVRFPKRMLMTTKGPKGETHTVTINLDKITLNETFPAILFRSPAPGSP